MLPSWTIAARTVGPERPSAPAAAVALSIGRCLNNRNTWMIQPAQGLAGLFQEGVVRHGQFQVRDRRKRQRHEGPTHFPDGGNRHVVPCFAVDGHLFRV